MHLDKLARRERALIAKCELQEGRLSSSRASDGAAKADKKGGEINRREEDRCEDEEEGEVEQGRARLRFKQMRQKKERLSYAVERLNLQAQQKERQLRMSVAAQSAER